MTTLTNFQEVEKVHNLSKIFVQVVVDLNRIHLVMYDSKLLFYADDCVHGDELWVSDGTYSGTSIVRDINPGSDGSGGSS